MIEILDHRWLHVLQGIMHGSGQNDKEVTYFRYFTSIAHLWKSDFYCIRRNMCSSFQQRFWAEGKIYWTFDILGEFSFQLKPPKNIPENLSSLCLCDNQSNA